VVLSWSYAPLQSLEPCPPPRNNGVTSDILGFASRKVLAPKRIYAGCPFFHGRRASPPTGRRGSPNPRRCRPQGSCPSRRIELHTRCDPWCPNASRPYSMPLASWRLPSEPSLPHQPYDLSAAASLLGFSHSPPERDGTGFSTTTFFQDAFVSRDPESPWSLPEPKPQLARPTELALLGCGAAFRALIRWGIRSRCPPAPARANESGRCSPGFSPLEFAPRQSRYDLRREHPPRRATRGNRVLGVTPPSRYVHERWSYVSSR